MEINSYAEYAQAKRVYKDVEIKNVGEIMMYMFKVIHYG